MTTPKPRRSAGQVAAQSYWKGTGWWIGWERTTPSVRKIWHRVYRACIRHHIQASKKGKSR